MTDTNASPSSYGLKMTPKGTYNEHAHWAWKDGLNSFRKTGGCDDYSSLIPYIIISCVKHEKRKKENLFMQVPDVLICQPAMSEHYYC